MGSRGRFADQPDPAQLQTDGTEIGGGSIRIPASCCGLVGLKPSQGRITLGPFRDESNLGVELCVSRTVRDTAALLDAVRGPGIGDTVIAPVPARPYSDEVGGTAPSARNRSTCTPVLVTWSSPRMTCVMPNSMSSTTLVNV